MSSVFKSPKVTYVQPKEVIEEIVDDNKLAYELERKRKKKMGAVSQMLATDRLNGSKRTLGE